MEAIKKIIRVKNGRILFTDLEKMNNRDVEIIILPLSDKTQYIENQQRPYALCANEFYVPDDFDSPLPEEIIKEFEG